MLLTVGPEPFGAILLKQERDHPASPSRINQRLGKAHCLFSQGNGEPGSPYLRKLGLLGVLLEDDISYPSKEVTWRTGGQNWAASQLQVRPSL